MNKGLTVLNLGFARTIHQWGNRDISSPFLRIYYARKGRARLHLPTGCISIEEGNMYLLPGYMPHTYDCDPGFEFYYLFVMLDQGNDAQVFDDYEFPLSVKGNEATRLLFENYCDLYPQLNLPSLSAEDFDHHPSYREYASAYRRMADYERLQLHGLVEILLSYFVKHARQRLLVKDDRIRRLMEYVATHLDEPVTVSQMASMVCLTESHLVKAFRKSLGITPLQYIIKKKIQHAQSLLLDTPMTVSEVARAIGMSDASYFIRLFKKNIGFTPQEYRERLIG
ncbi:MAG: helix-turn-helix transcriptional regulator [Prevotella sp.]|nr:helix-turn-helix transcriptional regulator [Prevotella sp.]MBR6191430.1 helix-turn-helix transcriptional regulator [Prevotella sp.]